jgi:4-hydroxy-4-methyl-2-oxoglutarate aldolase
MSIPDFSRIPTSAVADVLRAGGLPHRVLSSRVAHLTPGKRLAGPAYCVRGETALGAPEPSNTQNIRFELYRRILPGSVLLIGTGGYDEAAVFGENIALSAIARGCLGAVVDGGVRDRDALAQLHFPVYARFTTPVSSAGRWRVVELDEPLFMPGQTTAQILVNPGDWLVGDGDGVVVVPSEHAKDVASDAERLAKTEEMRRPDLIAGEDPEKVFNSMDRYGHVRRYAMGVFA